MEGPSDSEYRLISDIEKIYWDPWTGCRKKSEGCLNCFMFSKAAAEGRDGSEILLNSEDFYTPVKKDDSGNYIVKSGEILRVSISSDFFLEEADVWREKAWDIIRTRKDVIFFLLTKRPERIADSLPSDWGDGWENVICAVSCENQRRADERIPVLMSLPFRHRFLMLSPLIGAISLAGLTEPSGIDLVVCDEESYEGNRPCEKQWVADLREECRSRNLNFIFEGMSEEDMTYCGDDICFKLERNGREFPVVLSVGDHYGIRS